MFQSLEQRRLLSTLSLTGTSGADLIKMDQLTTSASGSTFNVRNVGKTTITLKVDSVTATIAPGASKANTALVAGSKITSFGLVDLQAGNDSFTPTTYLSVPLTQVLGGDGNDTITGSTQPDLILPGTGNDIVSAREGNDTVRGDTGNDSIDGGTGNDLLQDDAGNDTLTGNDGNDTLTGYEGSDSLVGGIGDDTYLWGIPAAAQTDTVVELANGGTDTLNFSQATSATSRVSVDLANPEDGIIATRYPNAIGLVKTPSGDEENFERVIGSSADDHFVGLGPNVSFAGGDGNDTLTTVSNAPVALFDGGAGDDLLNCDSSSYIDGYQHVIPKYIGGSGIDAIDGPFLLDIDLRAMPDVENASVLIGNITGNDFDNVLKTLQGSLYGLGGNDTLTVQEETYVGDNFYQLIGGDAHGGDGNDSLIALGDDFTDENGAEIDQSLFGDAGNDSFESNTHTVMQGGVGDDTFRNQNGRSDTVDGGDGFDGVQDDDIDTVASGIQNDAITNAEFVFDALAGATRQTGLARSANAVRPASAVVVTVAGVVVSMDGKSGLLAITGDGAANTIELDQTGTTIKIYVGKTLAQTVSTGTLKRILIDVGAGNDTLRLGTAAGLSRMLIGARVHGGAGNDTIIGGDGSDQLAGEAGSDSVNGGLGNDVLSGDYVVLISDAAVPSGAYLSASTDDDTILGGGGDTDLVSYTYRKIAISATAVNTASGTVRSGSEIDHLGGIEVLVTGRGDDSVVGSALSDLIFGGEGKDTLAGGAGSDQLHGGFGSDSLIADGGADFLDSGGDDGSVDRIDGTLSDDGTKAFDQTGKIFQIGIFDKKDFFSGSGRYFGTAKA